MSDAIAPTIVVLSLALVLGLAATAAGQPPPADPPADPVVAIIGGSPVHLSDVEQRWKEQDGGSFARIQQEQYESRRRALDSIIGAYLLDTEARRRGITVEKLIDAEITKRLPEPSEADILEAYTRSGVAAQGLSLDEARQTIVEMLEKRRNRGEALTRYLDELRSAARDVTVTFAVPRQRIAVQPGDPVAGRAGAAVEIVEFGDFQCPICRAMHPLLKRLAAEHKDQLRFVWKDFPLPGHPDARPSAEAARCAADQGKFWEYHDKLFDNQQALSKGKLKDYAKQLRLDQSAFASCLDKSAHAKDVQLALDEAATYGVAATPTVFINGRLVVGAVPYEVYERIVREELGGPTASKR